MRDHCGKAQATISDLELLNQHLQRCHQRQWVWDSVDCSNATGRKINEMTFVLLVILAILVDRSYFIGALCPIGDLALSFIADKTRNDWLLWPSAILTIIAIFFIPILGL